MKHLLDLLHYKNIDKQFYCLFFLEFLRCSYVMLCSSTSEPSSLVSFLFIYKRWDYLLELNIKKKYCENLHKHWFIWISKIYYYLTVFKQQSKQQRHKQDFRT